jgi:hypothetical protein
MVVSRFGAHGNSGEEKVEAVVGKEVDQGMLKRYR